MMKKGMMMATPFKYVTNSVGERFGQSIYAQSDMHDFKRIYLIYIRLNEKNQLYVRQVYYDYADMDRDQIERAFVERARRPDETDPCKSGVDGGLLPPVYCDKGEQEKLPFPNIFRYGYDAVHFGFEPCNVSIILDGPALKFYPAALGTSAHTVEETIVFRKDKVVTIDGQPSVEAFLPNTTFFDFAHGAIKDMPDVDVIRFNDLMLDEKGVRIPLDRRTSFNYCMDLYVRIAYDRAAAGPGTKAGPAWLPLVFDPPQSNGGSSGPP
jgi:hypothetical protein